MSQSYNLLHLREVQHLIGGTIYKPIETKEDFRKSPRDLSNIHIADSDYLDLINDNPQYYFSIHPNKVTSDIDTLAYLGLKVNNDDLPSSPSPIPYGDRIISTFTLDRFEYYKTLNGLFMRRIHTPKIEVCASERYNLAKSFLSLDDINHVELLENRFYKKFQNLGDFDIPQAGLTRGSNAPFYPSKKSLSIDEIKNKYKDGVK